MAHVEQVATLHNLPDVVTVTELGTVLRCGRNQAYALIRSGAIPSIKVGRVIRIPKRAVEEFLSAQGIETVAS